MSIKVYFLDNSGFMLDTDKSFLVFDYYKDPAHVVTKALAKNPEKPVVFFASHNHFDHFNSEIFNIGQNHRRVYVLSNDITTRDIGDTIPVEWMSAGDIVDDVLDGIRVQAFGSTDEGVSYLVTLPCGKTIFHAGDLNNWHWDMESTDRQVQRAKEAFTVIVDRIAREYPEIDIVFFPVDVRLGKNAAAGAEQFLQTIKTGDFFPMHFNGDFTEACDFAAYRLPDAVAARTRMYCLHKPGQDELLD